MEGRQARAGAYEDSRGEMEEKHISILFVTFGLHVL
jgi:hypothetical protein